MVQSKAFLAALIVSILCILPIWTIPVAPLSDWPLHLAISREIFLQLNGVATGGHYYLDFSFLGYSLVHLMLVFLQYVFSLEIAGKIVLSLSILIAPFCWLFFLQKIAPNNSMWCLAGLLLTYSLFFYYGQISFLFAFNFGLCAMGMGLQDKKWGNGDYAIFFLFSLLAFLSHAYAFFLSVGMVFAILSYRRLWLRGNSSAKPVAFALLILILAAICVISNHNLPRDTGYAKTVLACETSSFISEKPFYSGSGSLVPSVLDEWVRSNVYPQRIFTSIYPFTLLQFIILLALSGLALHIAIPALMRKKPLQIAVSEFIAKSGISFNPFLLAISGIFLLHYFILPECPSNMCFINGRSIPFAFAFFLASLKAENWKTSIAAAILALVAINIIFQASLFSQESYYQQFYLANMQNAAQSMPPGSTVLMLPFSHPLAAQAPYGQIKPTYSAFILVFNPTLYVSDLFLGQDTFILRTTFPIYDDSITASQYSNVRASLQCSFPVPHAYDYILYWDGSLQKNSA